MSTVFSDSETRFATASRRRIHLPDFLREPLLHFLVLGGLLFAADYLIAGRAADPHVIFIDAAVDQQARDVFRQARGREPNKEELYALRRVWLDNEVLYREGLAMQLDRGDTSIRERVIFKALSVVDAGTRLPKYDDQVLRDWFEHNRSRYDEPARYDFQEAVVSGDASEAVSRDLAARLNAGTPGGQEAGLRLFKGRPRANIVQSYGDEFAATLDRSQPHEWRALRTKDGWRVMRLESLSPARPADFENLRGVVLQDWTDATLMDQRSATVRALAQKYTVKVTEAAK